MDDAAFDNALIAAAFQMVAERGWGRLSVAAAAHAAGLSLARARERFPNRAAILLRFGRLADQAALAEAPSDGTVRDKLFYLLMRRIDLLQAHRTGVLALLRDLPTQPATALLLAMANRRSMRWMLGAADVPTVGISGDLRVKGLLAVWLWTIRAWRTDESTDLSTTMAALDAALQRAERMAGWLGWRRRPPPETPAGFTAPEEPPPVAPA
ncbi:MAG TPA: TetR family transcriptional regulator [Acetobacteraceae bacterium]|nr:TetR family transcriptional regulator [Acetobacteraceae bacterium]